MTYKLGAERKKQCEIVENQAGNTIYRHDT